jgi:pimeloyl-ACP methyl ester carboxylesterase
VVGFRVDESGAGPRVVLIHGSGSGGTIAWSAQAPLAERFRLVIPTRPGYAPNPALERIDFEEQADEVAPLLDGDAHLVGHSYGGVISMLVAAAHPHAVRSLTVSEPPAFRVAQGDADANRFVAELRALFGSTRNPEAYLRGFLAIVGSSMEVPSPLPPELEASSRASMAERPPWEAEIPLEALASARFPKLVISGAHHPAFDAVCDVLEERLGAERAVLPGAGHGIPRAPGYNERLTAFLDEAERARP